ncbi:hypothetical protein FVE85_9406 [Porphyridium purpureum]|uniref:Uncharacterized protein n=1 Tax=Porphyridium purpureum TaxID=35688 RepID=A0A5J4YIZ8_PORPP|nr:hypothetical protein FVE85_9406 [Porphyridium purpureum]|eukprot:POR3792..scf255_21
MFPGSFSGHQARGEDGEHVKLELARYGTSDGDDGSISSESSLDMEPGNDDDNLDEYRCAAASAQPHHVFARFFRRKGNLCNCPKYEKYLERRDLVRRAESTSRRRLAFEESAVQCLDHKQCRDVAPAGSGHSQTSAADDPESRGSQLRSHRTRSKRSSLKFLFLSETPELTRRMFRFLSIVKRIMSLIDKVGVGCAEDLNPESLANGFTVRPPRAVLKAHEKEIFELELAIADYREKDVIKFYPLPGGIHGGMKRSDYKLAMDHELEPRAKVLNVFDVENDKSLQTFVPQTAQTKRKVSGTMTNLIGSGKAFRSHYGNSRIIRLDNALFKALAPFLISGELNEITLQMLKALWHAWKNESLALVLDYVDPEDKEVQELASQISEKNKPSNIDGLLRDFMWPLRTFNSTAIAAAEKAGFPLLIALILSTMLVIVSLRPVFRNVPTHDRDEYTYRIRVWDSVVLLDTSYTDSIKIEPFRSRSTVVHNDKLYAADWLTRSVAMGMWTFAITVSVLTTIFGNSDWTTHLLNVVTLFTAILILITLLEESLGIRTLSAGLLYGQIRITNMSNFVTCFHGKGIKQFWSITDRGRDLADEHSIVREFPSGQIMTGPIFVEAELADCGWIRFDNYVFDVINLTIIQYVEGEVNNRISYKRTHRPGLVLNQFRSFVRNRDFRRHGSHRGGPPVALVYQAMRGQDGQPTGSAQCVQAVRAGRARSVPNPPALLNVTNGIWARRVRSVIDLVPKRVLRPNSNRFRCTASGSRHDAGTLITATTQNAFLPDPTCLGALAERLSASGCQSAERLFRASELSISTDFSKTQRRHWSTMRTYAYASASHH